MFADFEFYDYEKYVDIVHTNTQTQVQKEQNGEFTKIVWKETLATQTKKISIWRYSKADDSL